MWGGGGGGVNGMLFYYFYQGWNDTCTNVCNVQDMKPVPFAEISYFVHFL